MRGFDEDMLERLPHNYEPGPKERLYYRSRTTGERAYAIKRHGKLYMKLDRPNQEILRAYLEVDWVPAFEIRPLTRMQLGQIAYEADRKLCFFLKMHDKARREWLSMTDEQRIRWTEQGPVDLERKELWTAIMQALEKHAS